VNWYDAPNGNLLFSGSTFITPTLNATASFYAVAGTECPSSFVAVQAIVLTPSADPIVSDQSRCGDGTLTLTAMAVDTISWYDAQGGNLLSIGNQFTTPVLSQSTQYFAQAGTVCPGNYIPVNAFIHEMPSIELGPDTIIEIGSMIQVDAGAGFLSYQWSTGETTQIISVLSSGTYFVTVTDLNGCMAHDSIQVMVTVNIQPYVLKDGVLIYPNPTQSAVNISLSNEKLEDIFLRLVQDDGKLIWSDFSIREKKVIRQGRFIGTSKGNLFFTDSYPDDQTGV
jgi:hypothetical protein